MKFRTEIQVPPSDVRITYESFILSLGSCFAERIGSKLMQNKFSTLVNPGGILFNPHSISDFLQNAISDSVNQDHILFHNSQWISLDLHSSVSERSQEELIAKIRSINNQTLEFLRKTDILIITLGTAVSYRFKSSGGLVANCHKIPSVQFEKYLQGVEDVLGSLSRALHLVKGLNPDLKIILTVSPVRHVKDTLQLNSVSKSILRLACHRLSEEHENLEYFPSFEIMNDDLRDYRFYKDDLIHPTPFAENYIWEKFSETYFTPAIREIIGRWEDILLRLEHKPFNTSSEGYKKFINSTIAQLEELNKLIDCSRELDKLKSMN